MKRLAACVVVVALAAAGCSLFNKGRLGPKPQPATFSQYHLAGWGWDRVDRVVVLPFLNKSPYTHTGDELRYAFTSEMQRMGRFEVVANAPDEQAPLAAEIHQGGRFDEATMLAIGRATNADVVIHGIITHYSPYPRPRIGLIIQAVAPREAKIVASVDGIWDTTDVCLADRCRIYYRQRVRQRPPWIRNNVIACDDSFAADLALDSPALFQRWVSHEIVLTLFGLPVPGVISPGTGSPEGISPGMNSKVTPGSGELPPPQPPGATPLPDASDGKVK